MLKVSEVAIRLNLSVSKVYELIEKGRLGHHRMDGAIRVSEEQVEEYLDLTRREIKGERTAKVINRRPLRHIRL